MPLFSVTVREHAYTGRFYSDVVQAGSCEEALQVAVERAAVPWSPSGPTPRGEFDAAVTGRTRTGRPETGVVHAGRREDAQLPAAGRRGDAQLPAAGRRGDAQLPAALAGTRSYRPPGAAGRAATGPRASRGRAATGPRASRGRAATGPRAPRGGTGNGRRAGCCAPAGAWPPAAARIQRRGAGAGARRPGLHRNRAGRLQ